MHGFKSFLGVVVAGALAGGVGCCSNSSGATSATGGSGASSGTGEASASNGGSGSSGASNGGSATSGSSSAGSGGTGRSSATSGGTGSAGTGGSTGASATSGGTGSGASSGTGAATGGIDCTLPALITQSMELTTACDPWYIAQGGTTVESSGNGASPVLTVDPGVTVAAPDGAFLDIGPSGTPATLQVNGTQASPVIFTAAAGAPTPGSWVGVELDEQSNGSALSWTTISYAGATGLATYPAALLVMGGADTNMALLNNVTVDDNGGSGLNFAGHTAGLAAGSGNLTVSDWAAGNYPIVIDANEASTLPTSLSLAATGSGTPVVAMDCQDPTGTNPCGDPMNVDHTQTWPAIPVPYQIVSQAGVNVEGVSGLATLTIAAPNTLQFTDGSSFLVDTLGSGFGELVANGTAASHIVFQSTDPNPVWGAWMGIGFTAGTANTLVATSMSYCDVSDATGFIASVNLNANQTCSAATVQGMVYLDGTAFLQDGGTPGPSITNCTFTNYGGCAILTDQITTQFDYGPYDDVTACDFSPQGTDAAGNTFTPAAGADGGYDWIQADVCIFD